MELRIIIPITSVKELCDDYLADTKNCYWIGPTDYVLDLIEEFVLDSKDVEALVEALKKEIEEHENI